MFPVHRPFVFRSAVLLLAAALASQLPSSADAAPRRRRGPSSAQRYQQMVREYQQRLMAEAKANQERQEILNRFVLEKFDQNKNGRIEGAERGPAEHFLRDLRMGKGGHDQDAHLLNQLRGDLSKVKVQSPGSARK